VWLSFGLRPSGHRDEAWLKRGLAQLPGGWVYQSYYAGNTDLPGLGPTLLRTKGTPYEYNPFYLPGYAQGNVDIPAFTGCRDGSEDVSRLLTALVSGPDNPIESTLVQPLGLPWCTTYPKCT